MKYLNGYSALVKNWYFPAALCLIIVMSVLETVLQVIGIQLHIYSTINCIAIGIDCCIFFLLIFPYVMTLFVMRGQMRNASDKGILSKVDGIISKMSARIVTSIIIMYLPYVVFCTMRIFVGHGERHAGKSGNSLEKSEWFNFCLFVGYLLGLSNSFVNAIVFLSFNRKCRRKLLGLLFGGGGAAVAESGETSGGARRVTCSNNE